MEAVVGPDAYGHGALHNPRSPVPAQYVVSFARSLRQSVRNAILLMISVVGDDDGRGEAWEM
eukprot:3603682-Rhodomonas_salina.1